MTHHGTTNGNDASLAELLRKLSDQSTRLLNQEVELAKVEMAEKGKHLGIGAGMLGGAGFFAWFGSGALTAAAILGLATAIDGWLAALAVGALYLAIAGVLALRGRKQVDQAGPPVPEQAIETTKQDLEVAKARAREGRR